MRCLLHGDLPGLRGHFSGSPVVGLKPGRPKNTTSNTITHVRRYAYTPGMQRLMHHPILVTSSSVVRVKRSKRSTRVVVPKSFSLSLKMEYLALPASIFTVVFSACSLAISTWFGISPEESFPLRKAFSVFWCQRRLPLRRSSTYLAPV